MNEKLEKKMQTHSPTIFLTTQRQFIIKKFCYCFTQKIICFCFSVFNLGHQGPENQLKILCINSYYFYFPYSPPEIPSHFFRLRSTYVYKKVHFSIFQVIFKITNNQLIFLRIYKFLSSLVNPVLKSSRSSCLTEQNCVEHFFRSGLLRF